MPTQDQEPRLPGFYSKHVFIPIGKPIPVRQSNVLFNQLSEALNSPFHHLSMVLAGPEKTLSIRIAYCVEGEDPDQAQDEQE